MKTYGGVDEYINVFLTSALAGGEWSASRPCRFTPGKRDSVPTGWEGPRIDLDDVEKRKNLPLRVSNSNPLAIQPVVSRYSDCAIPAHAST
jgi:hypothetical protein